MPTMKKGMPKLSPFAQMLRDKREKLAPNDTLREFCATRGFDAPLIDGMERDRRTAPGTYGALYKLASGYGHGPTDRWTVQLLEAALGKAPAPVKPARPAATGARKIARSADLRRASRPVSPPSAASRGARSVPAPKGRSGSRSTRAR